MSQRHAPTRRIAITGVGVVSPIGIGPAAFWENLSAGRSGIRLIEQQPPDGLPSIEGFVGADIPAFDEKLAREYVPKNQRKSIKVMCRDIQLGTTSAMMAVQDSQLTPESIVPERLGVDFGANLMYSPAMQLNEPCWNCLDDQARFQMEKWATKGFPTMEPLWLLKYLPNMPACHIAIFLNAHGPSNSVTLNEASGNLALGEAWGIIQRGAADAMIVGGTGTRIHELKMIQAAMWGDLAFRSEQPEASCRPFDIERAGEVAAEGAASFILEEDSHAQSRGAKIWGYLLGSGSSCVPHDRQKAIANAMRAAMRSARVMPEDIGYINAHGLGSPKADLDEARAIHEVFGHRGAEIPVTALKGAIGNAAAGCGMLELAATLIGFQHGVIPPTVNCDSPDPECNLNIVRNEPEATKARIAMSLSFTRFGQASAVIVSNSD